MYNGEDSSDVSDYIPISALPCFSKILKRILYNRLHKQLIENILYSKQFSFQIGHSTDQIIENNKYRLDVFIDLSKTFDTADHSIFLKKFKLYGITDRNHEWVKSYLPNRK